MTPHGGISSSHLTDIQQDANVVRIRSNLKEKKKRNNTKNRKKNRN